MEIIGQVIIYIMMAFLLVGAVSAIFNDEKGFGKEFKDVFGSGDAQWRDLQADARGIRCAQSATSDATLRECCTSTQASTAGR